MDEKCTRFDQHVKINDNILPHATFLSGPEKLRDKEYLGILHSMCLNADYASVFFEGKVQQHLVSKTLLIIHIPMTSYLDLI